MNISEFFALKTRVQQGVQTAESALDEVFSHVGADVRAKLHLTEAHAVEPAVETHAEPSPDGNTEAPVVETHSEPAANGTNEASPAEATAA